MQIRAVSLPATDSAAQSDWYGQQLGIDVSVPGQVDLAETRLSFRDDWAVASAPTHLAFRTFADIGPITRWLGDRVDLCLVDGERSRRFDFLDADTVYFRGPDGTILECLCYDSDPRIQPLSGAVFAGITEVGLPATETASLVSWLVDTVGLSTWGTPRETFAWVGDRTGRFVVVPAGQSWYPTNQEATVIPTHMTVVEPEAATGTHTHPTLPYEITVKNESPLSQTS